MEDLFEGLSNPVRLWVVQHLSSSGPTRQVELARAFAASGLVSSPKLNEGAMSHTVKPLLALGLIVREGARGPLRLRYEEQTRRLISTASSLKVAITADAHAAADRSHAGLMRDITSAVDGASQPQTGNVRTRGSDPVS